MTCVETSVLARTHLLDLILRVVDDRTVRYALRKPQMPGHTALFLFVHVELLAFEIDENRFCCEDAPQLIRAGHRHPLQGAVLLSLGSHYEAVEAEAYIHPAPALNGFAGKPREEGLDFRLADGIS